MTKSIVLTAIAVVSLAATAIISTGAPAMADTIFDASGVFANGDTLGGTLTIDTALGTVTSSDLTVTGPDAGTYSVIDSQGYNSTPDVYEFFGSTSGGLYPELRLGTLATSLIGFDGGDLDSTAEPSPTNYASDIQTDAADDFSFLNSGALTPVPEPLTLSLFGVGLAGAAAMRRRKKAQRA